MYPIISHNFSQDEVSCIPTIFLTVGIFPSRVGYKYLRDAILLYDSCDGNMNKTCSEIASIYSVTKESVERDMRGSIDNACAKGSFCRLNDIIGIEVVSQGKKLKAKEFIALIYEFLNNAFFNNIHMLNKIVRSNNIK